MNKIKNYFQKLKNSLLKPKNSKEEKNKNKGEGAEKDVEKKEDINKSAVYHSLAPTDNAEGIQPYSEALNWALDEKDIKNIAITGGFSSGKSSFIKTFLRKRKEEKEDKYKFLKISLATFDLKGKEKKVEQKEQERTLKLIELSILQQIFYHKDDSKIPDSRFKKIKSLPNSLLYI